MKALRGSSRRVSIALLATALAVGTLVAVPFLQNAKAVPEHAGNLDGAFNAGGAITTQVATSTETVGAVAIGFQDRPVVAVSGGANGPATVAVMRSTTTNAHDRSFGSGSGITSLNMATIAPAIVGGITVTNATVKDLAVDDQNRTYVLTQLAGTGGLGNSFFAVTRLTAAGLADATFGVSSGTIVAMFQNNAQNATFAYALAVTPGQLYVAGAEGWTAAPNSPASPGNSQAVIRMFDLNGSSTGVQAAAPISASGTVSFYTDIAVDNAGRIVATGKGIPAGSFDNGDVMINRFDASNSPSPSLTNDATFAPLGHSDGLLNLNLPYGGELGVSVAAAPDNTVSVAYNDINVPGGATGDAGIIHLDADGSAIPGWNSGNAQIAFSAKRWPTAIAVDRTDSDRLIVSGYSDSTHGFVARFKANGVIDDTFGTSSVDAGYTYFSSSSNSAIKTFMGVDSVDRPVIASSTNNAGSNTSIRRFTADQSAGPEAATKILFDDQGLPAARSIYGMSPSGHDVNLFGNANTGDADTGVVADQGGHIFYSHDPNGAALANLQRADADDGFGVQPLNIPALAGDALTRPSVVDTSSDIFFISTYPSGVHCVLGVDADEAVASSSTPIIPPGGGLCDAGPGDPAGQITDAAVNPVEGVNQIAYVRAGNVWLTNGSHADYKLTTTGDATRVTWGFDGTVVLYNEGPTTLHAVTINKSSDGDPDLNLYTDDQIDLPISVSLTGFAMAPDGGAAEPIAYSSGGTIYTHALGVGGLGTPIYTGVDAKVTAWQRSLSIYPTDGSTTFDTGGGSVKAEDVPLQASAPVNNPNGGVQTSKLLNLNLLKSTLLNLNLLKSKLLNLNLLKSKLLNLNLLKSKLLNLNLLKSPLVEKGLSRTSLAALPINEIGATSPQGGWLDRLNAVAGTNAPASIKARAAELAALPLQQVTVADVLELGDFFVMPSLGEVDLTKGLVGSISVLPYLMGNTPVSAIDGIDWCGVFNARGYSNCGEQLGAVDSNGVSMGGETATLLSLQIAGFNLDDLPATPGHSENDLRDVHWDDVTFDDDAPLTHFSLYEAAKDADASGPATEEYKLDTQSTSIGSALIKNIAPTFAGRNAVVYCNGTTDVPNGQSTVDCSDTPANTTTIDAAMNAAGGPAVRSGTIVKDLGASLNNLSINEIALGLWGDPGDDPYDQSRSALGLPSGSPTKTFEVAFNRLALGPGQSISPVLDVDLPAGVSYRADSSYFVNVGGTNVRTTLAEPTITTPGGLHQHLQWTVPTTLQQDHLKIGFGTSLDSGTGGNIDAVIRDGYISEAVASDALNVADVSETGNTPASAIAINRDTLYFGRIDDAADIDYLKIGIDGGDGPPIAKGSTVRVYLSQLQYDADLVVYLPQNTPGAITDSLRPDEATSPLPRIPVGKDEVPKVYNGGEPLTVDGDADVPLVPGMPVAGLSNNRGKKAERVQVYTYDGDPSHNFLVQVSGFAGAHGTDTYAVRYTVTPPTPAPPAAPRSGFGTGNAGPTTSLGAVPQPKTLILTNMSRMERLYPGSTGGPNGLNAEVEKLRAARDGAVLPVDHVAGYAAWDAHPEDPDLANDVVRNINAAVDAYLAGHATQLESIVIVGTDEVIPMARLADLTQTGNESEFAQELRETAAGGTNNALLAAALAGRILSDDAYGAFHPRAFGPTFLYVPDVALGRLVETPAQITGSIEEYLAPQLNGDPVGSIRPTATLAAGYDFMNELGRSVRDAFIAQLPGLGAANKSLIGGWNRDDLINALQNGGSAPTLISINAHYSPLALAPAIGNSIVTATDFTAAADLRRRLLFTMGCHSGFSITDSLTNPGQNKDYPELTANSAVSAFIGNTGYGIGVADLNAFSQKLFADFALRLGRTTLGGALQQAKQEYLASGITNPYDYKVVAQATYFGIPDFRIVGATEAPLPPTAPNPVTNPAYKGMKTSALSISQSTTGNDTAWNRVDNANGSRWDITGGGNNIVQNRPIQPTVSMDVTSPNHVIGSAYITGLHVADEHDGFDPQLATTVLDDTGNEPEVQFGDVAFPTNPVQVTNFTGPDGAARSRAVATMAQFVSTGLNDSGNLVGIERRYDKIQFDAVQAPDGLDPNNGETGPVLTNAQAIKNPGSGTTDFSVDIADGGVGIARAGVLYRKGTENDFHYVDLTLDPSTLNTYRASLPVSEDINFVAEAVSLHSFMGFTSDKGRLYNSTVAPADTPSVSVTYADPQPTNGYFTGNSATVYLTQTPAGGTIKYKVNNGAEATYDSGTGIVVTNPNDGNPVPITYTYGPNQEYSGGATVRFAAIPAEQTTVIYDKSPTADGVFVNSVVAQVHSSDPDSVITINTDLDQPGVYTQRTDDKVSFTTDGVHSLTYKTSRGGATISPVTTINVDTAAPTIDFSSPADGANFSSTQLPKPQATFACHDTFLKDCVGSQATGTDLDLTPTAPGQTHSVTVTARDKSGRSVSETHRYTVNAATDNVTVTVDGTPTGAFYTAATNVRIDSSLGNPILVHVDDGRADQTFTSGHAVVPLSEDRVYTVSYQTTGLVPTTGSRVVKVDLAPPTVIFTTPSTGTPIFTLGQSVSADFVCADNVSGIASCVGPSSIDTATVTGPNQTRSATVTATDNVGRVASGSGTYKVHYADGTPCEGSTSHLLVGRSATTEVSALGASLDIAFRVCDAAGVAVGPPRLNGVAAPVDTSNGKPATGACMPLLGLLPLCLLSPLLSARQTAFSYQGSHTWLFRQDTTGLSLGIHVFRIYLPDDTSIVYRVKVLPN